MDGPCHLVSLLDRVRIVLQWMDHLVSLLVRASEDCSSMHLIANLNSLHAICHFNY